jgi:hypothetical protein
LELLKLFFGQRHDGVWEIHGVKSIPLNAHGSDGSNFCRLKDDLVLANPPFVGTVKWALGQSIVPVVAHVQSESILRCLGTGFFISCTGLLVTAAHVITDPIERRYGGVRELDNQSWHMGDLKLGVLIPRNPLFQGPGYIFRDIEWAVFLAERSDRPLPIPGVDLKLTSDTAICKVSRIAEGVPHQPLSIIQSGLIGNGMAVGKTATAVGYAGMQDVELTQETEGLVSGDFRFDLHVSTGTVLEHFPDNLVTRQVPTPGACFSASLKLPAGMSGSPIFDDERIYVHGVVSKGWEDENGPTDFGFGSMLAQSLALPIKPLNNRTLLELQKSDDHGMPKLSIHDA